MSDNKKINIEIKNVKKTENLLAEVLESEKSIIEKGEAKAERGAEAEPARAEKGKKMEETKVAESATGQAAGSASDFFSQQRQTKKQIEKIMETGLEEFYLNLPPDLQQKFKSEGELTINKIYVILSKTKVKVNKIISLIKKWLGIIPGLNKFFLEKEAKIKADEIIKLKVES